MNKFFRKFYVLIFVLCSVFLFSCADYLNDSNESSSSKLQAAMGITIENKDDGTPPNDILTVKSCWSLFYSDYTEYYIDANEPKTVQFTISAEHYLNFLYIDSEESSYVSLCSENNKTAGTVESITISSDGDDSKSFTDAWWLYAGKNSSDKTYTVTINVSSSGYVLIYVYQIPSPNCPPYSYFTIPMDYTFSFTAQSPVNNSIVRLEKGKSYTLSVYDSDTLSDNNYTDGMAILYTPSGAAPLLVDQDSDTYTAETTGEYILSVHLTGSSISDGRVRVTFVKNE